MVFQLASKHECIPGEVKVIWREWCPPSSFRGNSLVVEMSRGKMKQAEGSGIRWLGGRGNRTLRQRIWLACENNWRCHWCDDTIQVVGKTGNLLSTCFDCIGYRSRMWAERMKEFDVLVDKWKGGKGKSTLVRHENKTLAMLRIQVREGSNRRVRDSGEHLWFVPGRRIIYP